MSERLTAFGFCLLLAAAMVFVYRLKVTTGRPSGACLWAIRFFFFGAAFTILTVGVATGLARAELHSLWFYPISLGLVVSTSGVVIGLLGSCGGK